MLTAKKFAERAGITYPTVMAWLKKDLIPGAKFIEDSPHGSYWQIPAESLDKVERQKTGPKPKQTNGDGETLSGDSTEAADQPKPAKRSRKKGSEQ